jgi:hypothetical protein
LQSYRNSPGLEVMLVGIDGDQAEDMEMVRIAGEVCISPLLHAKLYTDNVRYSPRQWPRFTSKNLTAPLQSA